MISVIIPTYNRACYLEEMVESIEKMRNVEFEIVISDDHSHDNTTDVVKNLQNKYSNISYLQNSENRGCGYTRLQAYNIAKGDYIVFADDDDYYIDFDFYRRATETLESKKNLAFYSANVQYLYVKENRLQLHNLPYIGEFSSEEFLGKVVVNNGKPMSTFTTVFRKSALEAAEFSTMKMMNDVAIYMRASLFGGAMIEPDVIGHYRIHDSNISDSMTCSFIIQNLEEKKWVINRAKTLDIILTDNWLREIFIASSDYFFLRSKHSYTDIWNIFIWGKKNNVCGLKYLIKYCLIKSGLIHRFKR